MYVCSLYANGIFEVVDDKSMHVSDKRSVGSSMKLGCEKHAQVR